MPLHSGTFRYETFSIGLRDFCARKPQTFFSRLRQARQHGEAAPRGLNSYCDYMLTTTHTTLSRATAPLRRRSRAAERKR